MASMLLYERKVHEDLVQEQLRRQNGTAPKEGAISRIKRTVKMKKVQETKPAASGKEEETSERVSTS